MREIQVGDLIESDSPDAECWRVRRVPSETWGEGYADVDMIKAGWKGSLLIIVPIEFVTITTLACI